MTRTFSLMCVMLAAVGCGGAGSSSGGGSGNGESCKVSISGTPSTGTYSTCLLTSSGGVWTLTLGELPSCSHCTAAVTFAAIDSEMCGDGMPTQVVVSDPGWTTTLNGEAATQCPPGNTQCMPATPCTIATTSATAGGTAADYFGHWSGNITAHVTGVTTSGQSDVAADLTISGSF